MAIAAFAFYWPCSEPWASGHEVNQLYFLSNSIKAVSLLQCSAASAAQADHQVVQCGAGGSANVQFVASQVDESEFQLDI